ncbi:MFS transporter [Streptomyces lasalocidi]
MHAGGLRQGALVPVLVFLGTVVAVISSLGAPLVPTVAAVDHVSLSDAQWSLTVTMLVGAVVTPVMGRLGDGPRRRTAMLAAVATVLVGCVLGALPLGFPVLLVGRALQGVGLGLTPLAIATARDRLTGERARSAVAMLSITTVAGVGLGYPLTGLISQSFGVHARLLVRCDRQRRRPGRRGAGAADGYVPSARTARCARRRPARPGLGRCAARAQRGESWGWSAPGLLALAAAAPCCCWPGGCGTSCASRSRWSTCARCATAWC